ncbi:Chaperone SurA, partial [termite gut metagenome]
MKKFVYVRFISLLALLSVAGIRVYCQDNVIDEVVWIVGDEAILKSEIEQAVMDARYHEGRRFDGDPYCVIPEELAIEKLFLHQAVLDSVEVSESDVFRRVDDQINQNIQQIGSKEKMEEYFNKPYTQIREMM